MRPRESTFQSLLSQGISLLSDRKNDRRIEPMLGFNPFLVRASVYWVSILKEPFDKHTPFQSLLSQGISLLAHPDPAG